MQSSRKRPQAAGTDHTYLRCWTGESFTVGRSHSATDVPYRYLAAAAAALAGTRPGDDDPPLTDSKRTAWRKQALEWLQADLDMWIKKVEKDPPQFSATVRERLTAWQRNPDFAGVRDANLLNQLSQDDQASWQKLWSDVDAQLAKLGPAAKTK